MKNVVVLFCSKNDGGCTSKLLNFYLKSLKKFFLCNFRVDFFCIYDFKILPCDGCGFCFSNGGCVYNSNDDFLSLINLLNKCDVLVLATNVFFSGVPAYLKAFIDRCEQFYVKKFKCDFFKTKLKEGHLVLTGGNSDKIILKAILKCVKQFFYCINFRLTRAIIAPKTDHSGLFFLVK